MSDDHKQCADAVATEFERFNAIRTDERFRDLDDVDLMLLITLTEIRSLRRDQEVIKTETLRIAREHRSVTHQPSHSQYKEMNGERVYE